MAVKVTDWFKKDGLRVNHYEIPRVKDIVLDLDPEAFMFVTETVEVVGNFTHIQKPGGKSQALLGDKTRDETTG